MTLTLLVDLDDTLLGNKMETFIPAYLGALGSYLEPFVPPEQMVKTMVAATQCMFENMHLDRTLKGTFDPCFYKPLGLVEAEMRPHFEFFYSELFPKLKEKTQFRPKAVDFIEAALEREYQVGVATNPVFPLTAILQRLKWAGLDPQKYPFSLIPSYETFHFAKPNPAFFAEFLTLTGWPEGPVIMVGNDPDHDIRGANGIGIASFWISEDGSQFPEDFPTPTGTGNLEEFLPWIDSQSLDAFVPDYNSTSAMMAVLRGSPAGLTTALAEIPEGDWLERPGPEDWSLTEVICHLRDVENEVNLPRLRMIMSKTNPFIHGVDSDKWASERNYQVQDGQQALSDFITSRLETIDILENLKEGDWEKKGRHAIFGPTDLKEMIMIISGHERLHGTQIYKLIKNKK
jgi:FMN phosphatase YigB (HAD superfamily)